MPDVLKVVKDVVKLKAGAWVRMKRTIYRDDLAQVEQVDMAQDQVILRLIPRIDYSIKRGALRDHTAEVISYFKIFHSYLKFLYSCCLLLIEVLIS